MNSKQRDVFIALIGKDLKMEIGLVLPREFLSEKKITDNWQWLLSLTF